MGELLDKSLADEVDQVGELLADDLELGVGSVVA